MCFFVLYFFFCDTHHRDNHTEIPTHCVQLLPQGLCIYTKVLCLHHILHRWNISHNMFLFHSLPSRHRYFDHLFRCRLLMQTRLTASSDPSCSVSFSLCGLFLCCLFFEEIDVGLYSVCALHSSLLTCFAKGPFTGVCVTISECCLALFCKACLDPSQVTEIRLLLVLAEETHSLDSKGRYGWQEVSKLEFWELMLSYCSRECEMTVMSGLCTLEMFSPLSDCNVFTTKNPLLKIYWDSRDKFLELLLQLWPSENKPCLKFQASHRVLFSLTLWLDKQVTLPVKCSFQWGIESHVQWLDCVWNAGWYRNYHNSIFSTLLVSFESAMLLLFKIKRTGFSILDLVCPAKCSSQTINKTSFVQPGFEHKKVHPNPEVETSVSGKK